MCMQGVQAPGKGGKGEEPPEGEAVPAGRRSTEAVSASDALMNALELAAHEADRQKVCRSLSTP